MASAASLWIVGILCVLAGAAAGLLAGRRWGQTHHRHDQQQRLQQAEQQLKDYRLEVNSHFMQAADQLRQLQASYRAVHNQLARDARALCDRPGLPPILTELPESADGNAVAAEALQDVRPPLDYAPKSTPLEPGMLREDFGLDRPATPDAGVPPVMPDSAFVDTTDEAERNDYTGLSQSKN